METYASEPVELAARITKEITKLWRTAELASERVQRALNLSKQRRAFVKTVRESQTTPAALPQARESERFTAVGTTAVHLTHHLGNCFNNLSVSVQLLERRLAATEHDPRCIPIVRELRDEITRALRVLADLRLLSNVQAPRLQSTEVAAVVNGVVRSQASGFAERGVCVIVDVPLTLPLACADPEKLAQVVLNLCANAVEAMPQGGTLTLRADATAHRFILEVRDTGGGIPPGLKVFEPFFSTKPNKTGLGLAIAHRLMAAQHGTVTYTSTPGQGTTFTLTFPLANTSGGASPP